jgi:hypothetical protein
MVIKVSCQELRLNDSRNVPESSKKSGQVDAFRPFLPAASSNLPQRMQAVMTARASTQFIAHSEKDSPTL